MCGACHPAASDPITYEVELVDGTRDGTALVPFPSNYWTVEDPERPGERHVDLSPSPAEDPVDGMGPLRERMTCLDGFGTYAPVVFAFSGEIDTSPLPQGAEPEEVAGWMGLVDVDPDSPDQGQRVPLQWQYEPDGSVLQLSPLYPLAPGRRYAAYLTTAITGARGGLVRPSPWIPLLGSTEVPEEIAGEPRQEYLWQHLKSAGEVLQRDGFILDIDSLLGLTVFTTQSLHRAPAAIAAYLRARAQDEPPAPVLDSVVVEADGDEHIAATVVGRYVSGDYRDDSGDICLGPAELADGPAPKRWEELSFTLYLPALSVGPAPVVIFGHGLSSSRQEARGVARRLAALGLAVIAVDAPEHGDRNNGDMAATAFLGLDLGTLVMDVGKVRGNFAQTAYDNLQLLHLVQNRLGDLDVLPLGAPDGLPDVAPAPTYYMGASLGGITASLLLALAPEIDAAVLTMPGAGFRHIVFGNAMFSIFGPAFLSSTATEGDVLRFLAMLQAAADGADPVNFASFLGPSPVVGLSGGLPREAPLDLLLMEAMLDEVVANSATAALARTAGVPLLPPVQEHHVGLPLGDPLPAQDNWAGVTAGLFQVDEVVDGTDMVPVGHFTLVHNAVAVTQWLHFFETALQGSPEIIDPYVTLGLR